MFSHFSQSNQQYLARKHCLHLGHDSQTPRANHWEDIQVNSQTSSNTTSIGSSGLVTGGDTVNFRPWLSPSQGWEQQLQQRGSPVTQAPRAGVHHQQVPSAASQVFPQHQTGYGQAQLVHFTREVGHLTVASTQHGRTLVGNSNGGGSAWGVPTQPHNRDGRRQPQQIIQSETPFQAIQASAAYPSGCQVFAVPILHQDGFRSYWVTPNTRRGGQMSRLIDPAQGAAVVGGVTVKPEESPGLDTIDRSTLSSMQGIPNAIAQPAGDQWLQTGSKSLNKSPSTDNKDIIAPPQKRTFCKCPFCKERKRGNNSRPREQKRHICHMCGKIYRRASHLNIHLRCHLGEHPFVCRWMFCSKRFSRSDMLQRHERTHTDEKTYFCPVCSKGFGRKDHLSKHMKTHSNQEVDTAVNAANDQAGLYRYGNLSAPHS